MRIIYITLVLVYFLAAQEIPPLPIAIGAGTAEVHNGNIYKIGGSNSWSGNTQYPRIYKFDGQQWSYHDSIPDNDLWDVESVLVGDDIYLISGWPYGQKRLRSYNINSGTWNTDLAQSPNSYTWGVAAEYLNGHIYVFDPAGNVFEYDIANDEWTTLTNAGVSGSRNLSSIVYKEKMYVIGYNDSTFMRYDPATDMWEEMAKSYYQVGAPAMGIINEKIYCVGGNINNNSAAGYKTIIVYDALENSWEMDSLKIDGKRHWMATAEYEGGLYVLGGFDSTTAAVDKVEQIVPQGTAVSISENEAFKPGGFELYPAYPNPFNPQTTIRYRLARAGEIELAVFNSSGRQVAILENGFRQAREYSVTFNAKAFSSGIYFYRLRGPGIQKTQKMLLIK